MATDIPPLMLSIQLETDRLKEQVADLQSTVQGLGTSMASQSSGANAFAGALDMVGNKLKQLAIAAVGIGFLKQSLEAAVEGQKAMALFSGQLERSTGATKTQIDAVNAQIKAMSQLSAVSSGTIRPAFEKLVTITGDLEKSLQLQSIAMDVSAGTGKPLSMVTLMIGKAATGTTAALNRLVPGISSAKDPMQKLADTFKGAAKEAANNDPYARMNLIIKDVQKSIGKALLPAMDAMEQMLKDVAPLWKSLSVPIGQLVKSLAPLVVQLVRSLIPALQALLPPFMKLVSALLPPLIKLFNSLMPIIVLLIDLFVALMPVIMPIVDAFVAFADAIADYVINQIKILITWLEPLAKWLGDVLTNLMDFFGIKPKAEIDVTGVHDAIGAYTALTDAQNKNAGVGGYAAPKTPNVAASSGGGGSGSTSMTPAQRVAEALKNIKKLEQQYNKNVQEITKQRNDDLAKLEKDHQSKIQQIMSDGSKTLADIVLSSQKRLRDAFASVTSIDAGSMFVNAGASISNFVMMLKDKLMSTRTLADDAAKLAGAGYSQTFIEQIIAQGPDVGDQLAKQLLAATPEQAAQIQSLFGTIETESLHSVDTVAANITKTSGLATEELRNAYATAQGELVTALKSENDAYAQSVIDVTKMFDDAMTSLEDQRNKAMKKSIKEINNALGENAKTLNAAMRNAEREMGASAGRMVDTIRRLLNAASESERAAILGSTTATLTDYSVSGVSSPSTPSAPVTINISVATNATAEDIAAAVSNAIKYNLPYTVTGSTTA
jgi:phage-related protein